MAFIYASLWSIGLWVSRLMIHVVMVFLFRRLLSDHLLLLYMFVQAPSLFDGAFLWLGLYRSCLGHFLLYTAIIYVVCGCPRTAFSEYSYLQAAMFYNKSQ
ncbi:hypothetical protein K505DRAFT_329154 [Melanomma pulvis-pyrius CBS 109.77]|uniref:Uncharacterized protein n=1 Tax=Melanomma pulvis-pyrius CBS 109.77 TaxID=1314802 RepID=A0A6A6WW60_9PLEO|nr:hypothetical protein K505DRAFT_329154 [Melanomma pulvis-pyrius CBS 109.77]